MVQSYSVDSFGCAQGVAGGVMVLPNRIRRGP